MYLDSVLGSKTKVNLLSVLIQNPEKAINEGQLAKKAGVSASEVNRQVNDLVVIGLVSLTRVGRSKLYSINHDHFLYQPLNQLYRSLNDVYRKIAENYTTKLSQIHEVKTIFLFGSLESGSIREDYVANPSDIDIIIVVENESKIKPTKKIALDYAINEVFTKYAINIHSIVLTIDEYIKGLQDDLFIMNVHTRGELMYGEKPSRFNKMGSTQINRVP